MKKCLYCIHAEVNWVTYRGGRASTTRCKMTGEKIRFSDSVCKQYEADPETQEFVDRMKKGARK